MTPQMSNEDFDEIHQAWAERDKVIPKEDQPEFKEFLQWKMQQEDPPIDPNETEKAIAGHALDALDYGAGLIRTPIMQAASALGSSKSRGAMAKNFVQDWKDALTPLDGRPAPSVHEWRQRGGVTGGIADAGISNIVPGFADPKAPHSALQPEKGGMLDITPGGVLDFTGDYLMAPGTGAKAIKDKIMQKLGRTEAQVVAGMTAAQLRARAVAMLQREQNPTARARLARALGIAMDPMGNAVEGGGKALYKTAFTEADAEAQAARRAGQAAALPSDTMLEAGVDGSRAQLAAESNRLKQGLADENRALVGGVTQQFPMERISLKMIKARTKAKLEKALAVGGRAEGAQAAVDDLKQQMQPYRDAGKKLLTPAEANDLASSMQQRAADLRAYEQAPIKAGRGKNAARNAGEARAMGDASASLGRDARESVENLLDDLPGPADERLGGELWRRNQKLGSLIGGQAGLDKAASRGTLESFMKNLGIPVAGAGAAGLSIAVMQNPWLAAGLAGTGALLGSTRVRTKLGRLGATYGKDIGSAVRAKAVEDLGGFSREASPWTLLKEDMEKK